MINPLANSSPVAADPRWKTVEATVRRYGGEPGALIETLHAVQESFGYLDEGAMRQVAFALKIPPSKVYGVATFYHFFTLKPPGEHTCVVCLGTACYIKGSAFLISEIEQFSGIKPGETTPNGKMSLLTARCLGSCGLAPAVVFDGEVSGRMTPPDALQKIRGWLDHAS
ncbi:MAG: bidirectional hydrogenase complex protein HoxE [Thermodesulfovibrionales bacterium]|jgi:bidirectional [NiFe] hydrogenase diaphorase subunit